MLCELTKLVHEKVVAHHAKLNTNLLPPAYREISIWTANKVVGAIENGNPEEASMWMKRHLDAIRDELKNIIE